MSTVVATKRALVDVLSHRPALASVQVTYGDDVKRPRKERIYLGDVEDSDAAPSGMRATKVRFQEDFTLRLFVLVDSKLGHEATEARAFALLEEVLDALAHDPKLSTATTRPPGLIAATYAGFRLSTTLVSEGEHRASIEADIAVKARNA